MDRRESVNRDNQADGHINCKGTHNHGVDCTSIFSDHRECKEEGYSYVGGTQFNRQAFVS